MDKKNEGYKMKFKKGGCWEFAEFEIEENYELSSYSFLGGSEKKGIEGFKENCCKHAHSFKVKTDERYDESTCDNYVAIIPFVVIQYNEAGHASTGVCAECVAEGLKKIRIQNEMHRSDK